MSQSNDFATPRPALEYARPMPPVRVRQVLPRSLAMTLMIGGLGLMAMPGLAVVMALWGRETNFPDSFGVILFLTALGGVMALWFSIYLSPRVPRTGE